ncbi:TonB-dependent receptor [Pedobacter rhizosphaerae]|uniref:Iron complex outermembrane recepter protein n=1 Tax=Pedobacter rhizosphaerae TaxID=390241 RepID=A0A1H9R7Z8_9SPHI|nr:TonB-dependent receptor [Pedobacter rhizosphaerae]SER68842.1 iron complex outermembrane recepter protein [Pedobacter rhizosphaerae]
MNKILSLVSIFLLTCFAANAQQNSLSGTIKNNKREPIGQVTIQVLNTNLSVVSKADGTFEFEKVPSGKLNVKFTALGYASTVKTINGQFLEVVLEGNDTKLDEITVSAQKIEEKVQGIPASITVLSAAKISDYRIQNTRDLSAIVPNLYSSNPGDGRNVTSIRGIGTTSYDPAVATYIDGVNQFGLDTYIASLFDVERIEVLRGPQGTLYGRNAMGGVINIITKQPTNATNGFAGVDIGNYGQQRYSAGIRTPLIKNKLFFGAAGLYNKQNGFYTNEFNNTKFDKLHGYLGNYYLKFLASSKFALTLNVKHNENRNNGTFPLAGSVDEALANPFKLNQNATTEMVDNLFNASLSANYAAEDFNFSSQTAYQSNYRYYKQPIDGDFSPLDAVAIVNDYGKDWNKVEVYTQEIKFSSSATSASRLKWLGGLYGFYQRNPVKQGTYFGADGAIMGAEPFTTAVNINSGKGAGLAAFGQLSYQLTDQLNATAGLRYDYEHKKLLASGEYLIPGMDPIVTQGDTSAKANFHAVSPKLSLSYLLASDNQIYVSYSRGYRAGGITQLASDPSVKPLDAYKPEYSNNIELGSKNTFFNQRLSVNLAAFYIQVTDAQIPILILPDALTTTRNAGKLTSKGFDLELSAKPVKGLSMDYNLGYTDAKYKSLNLSKGGTMVDLSGNKQIYTPEMTSMLALQYAYEIDSRAKLNVIARGEWSFIGNQFYDLSNEIQQKGYNIYNAKVGFSAKAFDLFFWGRNLANKTYVDYAYDFGAAHLGNPKTYGLSLIGRF